MTAQILKQGSVTGGEWHYPLHWTDIAAAMPSELSYDALDQCLPCKAAIDSQWLWHKFHKLSIPDDSQQSWFLQILNDGRGTMWVSGRKHIDIDDRVRVCFHGQTRELWREIHIYGPSTRPTRRSCATLLRSMQFPIGTSTMCIFMAWSTPPTHFNIACTIAIFLALFRALRVLSWLVFVNAFFRGFRISNVSIMRL